MELKQYVLKEMNYYKVHGRTVENAYPLPLFFNSSGIEVNVSGSELWIEMEVDYDIYEPWIWTEVNGAFVSRQMLQPGAYSLCLFRGMNPGTVKNVKFMRELQAMAGEGVCQVLVRGFQSDGQFFPVPEKRFKLEFIGDSITSGEGTYGALGEMDWIPMYMSSSHCYAQMVSKALDADCRLISHGGFGVLCGWDNNPYSNIPSCYEKVCGLLKGEQNEKLGALQPYDFTKWKPDAIIVNLGTNDAGAFDQPAWTNPVTGEQFQQRRNPDGTYHQEDLARFEKAAVDFLFMLRKNNPDAHIVWVYGMLGYDLTLAITEAVNAYRRQSGDNHAAFLQLPDTTAETIGAREHPGKKSHKRAAKVLTEYLQKVLGA